MMQPCLLITLSAQRLTLLDRIEPYGGERLYLGINGDGLQFAAFVRTDNDWNAREKG